MQNDINTYSAPKDTSWTEALNFIVTNYIPRVASTRLMGRLSKIVSASDSPTGDAMLIIGNGVSGTTSFFNIHIVRR
jgi:hypothetical protein